MFFKIGPKHKNAYFSFLIGKHPDNAFEREVGAGRIVRSHFDNDSHFYEGHVENDSLQFVETAKKLNMSSYVHTQLGAVCPHNLRGFDQVFRSAIRAKFDVPEDVESFCNAPDTWVCYMGPFPSEFQRMKYWFGEAGISVETFLDEEDSKWEHEFLTYNLKFESAPMPLAEFLQKLYLISYYMTIKHEMVPVQGDMVEKFVGFCQSWVELLPKRNRLINVLCKYRKDHIKKFENILTESNDDLNEAEKQNRAMEIDGYLQKKNIHTKRHDLIVERVPDVAGTRFMELGCGGGKLLRFLRKERKSVNIIGIELNSKLANKCRNIKGKTPVHISNSSILFPKLQESDLKPDFLACTEVLEHLEMPDRQRLIKLLKKMYIPRELMVTVPNIEYNHLIPGLVDEDGKYTGKYRHPDHKIEYTTEQFAEEVIVPLSEMYTITSIKLLEDEEVQPSFIIHCKLKPGNWGVDWKIFRKIQDMYQSIYLPISNYVISSKEMASGFASRAMQMNGDNLFYVAPTMSPVDWNPLHPESLEHPTSAFAYYIDRAQTGLWAECKYMGSRGYALVFKEEQKAKLLGYSNPVIVNSRGGYPFFEDGRQSIDWTEFRRRMTTDYIILDTEILPWSFKGDKLIKFDFQVPGECTYLSRKYGGYGHSENAKKFLDTLELFQRDQPLEIRIFDILASGNVEEGYKQTKFKNTQLGFFQNRQSKYKLMDELTEGLPDIHSVERYWVNLDDPLRRLKIVDRWEQFCSGGGEGFVFKLDNPITYAPSGYLVQPCVKVRGADYLRLIYGIDYLESDYFNKIKYRKTTIKRRLAIQEFEIGMNILRAWSVGNKEQMFRYIAGFFGSEHVNHSTIDATL